MLFEYSYKLQFHASFFYYPINSQLLILVKCTSNYGLYQLSKIA